MLEVGKVYTFKFNSGEEVVAKIETAPHGASHVTVTDPVSIAPGPQGMGLVPSMFTANPGQTVTINTNNIAMYAETEESVRAKYIEATTGIAIPDKKIIMG